MSEREAEALAALLGGQEYDEQVRRFRRVRVSSIAPPEWSWVKSEEEWSPEDWTPPEDAWLPAAFAAAG